MLPILVSTFVGLRGLLRELRAAAEALRDAVLGAAREDAGDGRERARLGVGSLSSCERAFSWL